MAIVSHTCNGGMAKIVSALEGSGIGTLYIAIGTGAGTAAVTDTAMSNEDTTTGRVAATLTQTTTTNTNDTLTATAAFTFGVNETVTELGLWSASTGGTLLAHVTGLNIPVGASNSLPSGTIVLNVQEVPQ